MGNERKWALGLSLLGIVGLAGEGVRRQDKSEHSPQEIAQKRRQNSARPEHKTEQEEQSVSSVASRDSVTVEGEKPKEAWHVNAQQLVDNLKNKYDDVSPTGQFNPEDGSFKISQINVLGKRGRGFDGIHFKLSIEEDHTVVFSGNIGAQQTIDWHIDGSDQMTVEQLQAAIDPLVKKQAEYYKTFQSIYKYDYDPENFYKSLDDYLQRLRNDHVDPTIIEAIRARLEKGPYGGGASRVK